MRTFLAFLTSLQLSLTTLYDTFLGKTLPSLLLPRYISKNTLPPPRNITRDKSVSIAPVTLPPAKDTKYIT